MSIFKGEKLLEHLNSIFAKTLLSNESESFYFKDLDSRFIAMSNYQMKLFGISKKEDYFGKTDFDFFTKEHAAKAYQDEQTIIRTGQPIIGFVEQETWEENLISYVVTFKYPLYDEDRNVIGTWGHSANVATSNGGHLQSKFIRTRPEDYSMLNMDKSLFDNLTSLKNTKAFYEMMNMYYQESMNSLNVPDSEHILVLIDMNNFKSINSNYGHHYGDKALVFASKLIENTVTADIQLFRYAGDVFALLIDSRSYDASIKTAQKIIQTFNETPFHSDEESIKLAVSIGMSKFKESLPFGNIHDIINLTDKRLYAAKKLDYPSVIYDNTYRL